MITSDQWRAYNEAVESIRSDAASEVERRVSEYMASEWDGDVASAREAAKRIMASQVAEYDRRAASLAAAWYDAQARESGAKLDRAVTAVTYTNHDIDALARYQAGKLDGDVPDPDEFSRMCGEFAANDAMKSVNRTILRNVKRDREKGAKFARVTSGRNTCAFCLMLAGRGAVYHSRKTAGQFDHWHRHCTCKVVPCFSGNRYEVLVEGHDPKKIEARLAEIEERTGVCRNTSAFNREVRLRDPDWLFGDEAATDYSLNPIEAYGTLVKPGDYSLENIANKGNEYRDLWAHHVLEDYGYKVTVRPPEALDALGRVIDGVTCPDLFIGDEIWEVKSPPPRTAPVKPGNELKFLNAQMRSADKNFRNPYDVGLKAPMASRPPTRVVLNMRYAGDNIDISSDAFASKLMAEMKQFDVHEVMAIDADGRIVRYKKSAQTTSQNLSGT